MDSEATGTDIKLASQYALHVALQTMKERCGILQRRLATVEEENQQLRQHFHEDGTPSQQSDSGGGQGGAEYAQLRLQLLADMQRQKTQLSEHISMVSNENRKLWSRLSQMTKEPGHTSSANDSSSTLIDDSSSLHAAGDGATNQHLIRSKTFTQHSPNPNLRHKLISNQASVGGVDMKDVSLEEVALEAYEHDALVADCDSEAQLGFAYLKIDGRDVTHADVTNAAAGFTTEAKKCFEGMQAMRSEALRQQQELSAALTFLKKRPTAVVPCPECAKTSQKPEMADKSLETDESLNEVNCYNNSKKVLDTSTYTEAIASKYGNESTNVLHSPHFNVIEEKIRADAIDKMCPMCGKIFSNLVSFEAFTQHVEMHFVDDAIDVEAGVERTYELVSHTVGDF